MKLQRAAHACAALSVLLHVGCATRTRSNQEYAGAQRLHENHRDFWTSLESLCGVAFEGRIVEDSTGNPDFADKTLVMHVRRCETDRILVPFHVGDNRSRTWVFTQTSSGLRLKHDHRHEDGAEDEITQYGGDTVSPGTPTTQEFHADAYTASLIPAAATNVWTLEIIPGHTYTYSLRREGTDRRFRVIFDLSRPVATPPPPWGDS